jgi:hypothetical protein
VKHGLLVGLTLMAILVADPAMARRGNAELPPGVKLVPVERPAAHAAAVRPAAHAPAVRPAAQTAAVRQDVNKPILRHGRHASKPHAGTGRSGAR